MLSEERQFGSFEPRPQESSNTTPEICYCHMNKHEVTHQWVKHNCPSQYYLILASWPADSQLQKSTQPELGMDAQHTAKYRHVSELI